MPVRACMCFLIRIYSLLQPPRSLYYNKELMKRTLGRPTYAFEARQYVVSVCVCVRERERERSECVCVCVCERECYREREKSVCVCVCERVRVREQGEECRCVQ